MFIYFLTLRLRFKGCYFIKLIDTKQVMYLFTIVLGLYTVECTGLYTVECYRSAFNMYQLVRRCLYIYKPIILQSLKSYVFLLTEIYKLLQHILRLKQ